MATNIDNIAGFHIDNQYGFKYRTIETRLGVEAQKAEPNTLTHNAIFFQLEGELHISWGKFSNTVVKPGQLYFLPRGANVSAYMVGSKIRYIAARLDHDLDNTPTFNRLIKDEEKLGGVEYSFEPLPIKEPLSLFLDSVQCYIVGGTENRQLQSVKLMELYIIFRLYYSKLECVNLFYPIIKKKSQFQTFVLDNYSVTITIDELAQKANMSRSTFDRNFKDAFGMTPHKWFEVQTRILILRKAAEPNVSVKDLMYEVGVYNASQFTQLCKRLCGVAPSQLIRR